jgi:hypothetical protein
MVTIMEDRRSRGLPGVVAKATETDIDVLRLLRANRASTASLSDLRSTLAEREPGLRDSLWALEAGGLVEVLESPSAGLICVLTERGRDHLDRLGPPEPRRG